MNASDIMTVGATSVQPDATIAHATRLMLENGIGGVPVIDPHGRIVGIVTEGDLLHRKEIGTGRPLNEWSEHAHDAGELARRYAQERGRKVEEVMSRDVVTVEPGTPIGEIVDLMERRNFKRLPVVSEGRLVGMVSRSNVLAALSRRVDEASFEPLQDVTIRQRIVGEMSAQPWGSGATLDIDVQGGVVTLEGTATSEHVRQAVRALAENTPGVVRVFDRIRVAGAAPE